MFNVKALWVNYLSWYAGKWFVLRKVLTWLLTDNILNPDLAFNFFGQGWAWYADFPFLTASQCARNLLLSKDDHLKKTNRLYQRGKMHVTPNSALWLSWSHAVHILLVFAFTGHFPITVKLILNQKLLSWYSSQNRSSFE